MKKFNARSKMEYGQKLLIDMYADGSLETVECTVDVEDGANVWVKYTHPIYSEAGTITKLIPKKAFYVFS
jgi:hypothetical protein